MYYIISHGRNVNINLNIYKRKSVLKRSYHLQEISIGKHSYHVVLFILYKRRMVPDKISVFILKKNLCNIFSHYRGDEMLRLLLKVEWEDYFGSSSIILFAYKF